MVSLAEIKDGYHVLELWFWKWNITRKIISNTVHEIRISALEINKDAYEEVLGTVKEADNITLYNTGAENIVSLFGKESIDVIISSLPLGSLSHEQNTEILAAIHTVLKPGSKYIQYQYWQKNKEDIRNTFHFDHTYYDIRNIPPVFIYVTHK